MKKFLILALALVMALSLAACGGSEAPAPAPETTAPETTAPEATPEPEKAEVMAVTFDMPEGFESSENIPAGVSESYVNADGSNINVAYTESSPLFGMITQEILETGLTETFKSQYDLDVALTTNEFNSTEVEGYPAYVWDVTYDINGVAIHQYIVSINANINATVTYTDQTSDGSHIDAFYASADSITLVTE